MPLIYQSFGHLPLGGEQDARMPLIYQSFGILLFGGEQDARMPPPLYQSFGRLVAWRRAECSRHVPLPHGRNLIHDPRSAIHNRAERDGLERSDSPEGGRPEGRINPRSTIPPHWFCTQPVKSPPTQTLPSLPRCQPLYKAPA